MQRERLRIPEVAALVNGIFAREKVLVCNGLDSFIPLLRFIEDFSESREELDEYRYFEIGVAKRYISNDPDFEAWFDQQRAKADERYEVTGDPSERQIPGLKRRWWKEQAKGNAFAILQPYKQERMRLWDIEVTGHSTQLSSDFEAQGKSRVALFRAVMEQEQHRTGLGLDRKLSSTRSPAYSLAVGKEWKIAMRLDHVALAKPYGGPTTDVRTGQVFPGGVQFSLHMDVCLLDRQGGGYTSVAPVRFDSLFPIGSGLFGPASYAQFSSLHQLEALVRIHAKMFSLIRPELESALLVSH
jgi:hypothetical protein